MANSESRRQRRQIAKKLGYIKKDETLTEKLERIRRSNQMGKQLHTQHLEAVKNAELETKRNKEKQRVNEKNKEENTSLTLTTESFDFLKDIEEEPEASTEGGIDIDE